jgi:hypothetical protein
VVQAFDHLALEGDLEEAAERLIGPAGSGSDPVAW